MLKLVMFALVYCNVRATNLTIFPAFSQHFPTIFPQIGLAKMVKKGVDGAALEALVEGGAAFFLLEMVEIYPEMNGNK